MCFSICISHDFSFKQNNNPFTELRKEAAESTNTRIMYPLGNPQLMGGLNAPVLSSLPFPWPYGAVGWDTVQEEQCRNQPRPVGETHVSKGLGYTGFGFSPATPSSPPWPSTPAILWISCKVFASRASQTCHSSSRHPSGGGILELLLLALIHKELPTCPWKEGESPLPGRRRG